MTGDGYLRAVLVDGAQPFVYRFGVARLLGHVDDGLRLRFVARVTTPSFPSLWLRTGRGQPRAAVAYRESGSVASAATLESAVCERDMPVPDNAQNVYTAPPIPSPTRRTEPLGRSARLATHTGQPAKVAPDTAPSTPTTPEMIVVPSLAKSALHADLPGSAAQTRAADEAAVVPSAARPTIPQHTAAPPPVRRPAPRPDPPSPEPSNLPMLEFVDTPVATLAKVPPPVPSVHPAVARAADEPGCADSPIRARGRQPAAPRSRFVIGVDNEFESDACQPATDSVAFRLADIAPNHLDTSQWHPPVEEPGDMEPAPPAARPPTQATDPIVITDDAEPFAVQAFWARRHAGRLRPRLLR